MQQKLDPKARWLFFYNYFTSFLFFVLIIQIWGIPLTYDSGYFETYLFYLFVFVVLFIYGALVLSQLVYRNYSYELVKEGFVVRRGVIVKVISTIPYSRIQNIDLRRGIFERVLGLTSVMVQTAGFSAVATSYSRWSYFAEGYIPGLSQKSAEKLRSLLFKKVKSNRRQGL
ncbi:PH domain-containing protein [Candidatus Woesearchaeota archaeon]|nr:PH domain-containing protein [Candidatus Woesearchaeota archaeon]